MIRVLPILCLFGCANFSIYVEGGGGIGYGEALEESGAIGQVSVSIGALVLDTPRHDLGVGAGIVGISSFGDDPTAAGLSASTRWDFDITNPGQSPALGLCAGATLAASANTLGVEKKSTLAGADAFAGLAVGQRGNSDNSIRLCAGGFGYVGVDRRFAGAMVRLRVKVLKTGRRGQ